MRHLKIRSDQNIGISTFTLKKKKRAKKSSICDHLLQYNNNPSFVRIKNKNKKYKQEYKNNKEHLLKIQ